MGERLLLWDIDGTLMRSDGLGELAFEVALEKVLGERPAHRVAMAGRTDLDIAAEYLESMGRVVGEHLEAVLGALGAALGATFPELQRRSSACPGVREALSAFAVEPGCHQSVLTGNIAVNAALKLDAVGLRNYLDLEAGAFGDEAADRRELLPIALQRQWALRGRAIEARATWVIGDSPLDLACARAGGARCCLVATGVAPFEELARLDADAVLHDLADLQALRALIGA